MKEREERERETKGVNIIGDADEKKISLVIKWQMNELGLINITCTRVVRKVRGDSD